MEWVSVIVELGFPIACVLALSYFVWVLYQASVKREERLMEVNEKAIDTISKYADRLTVIEEDVKEIKNVILENGGH